MKQKKGVEFQSPPPANLAVPSTNSTANSTINDVIGSKSDSAYPTQSGHSTKSLMATCKAAAAQVGGNVSSAGFNKANDTNEQTVLTETGAMWYEYIAFDMTNMTKDTIFKFKWRLDGVNYQSYLEYTWPIATGYKSLVFFMHYPVYGGNIRMQVTVTSPVAEGAVRAMNYAYSRAPLE